MPLDLAKIPKGYPVGWCYAPSTRKHYPDCDVSPCAEIPKFGIYLGFWIITEAPEIEGLTKFWYYVCKTHRDWLKKNSEREMRGA